MATVPVPAIPPILTDPPAVRLKARIAPLATVRAPVPGVPEPEPLPIVKVPALTLVAP